MIVTSIREGANYALKMYTTGPHTCYALLNKQWDKACIFKGIQATAIDVYLAKIEKEDTGASADQSLGYLWACVCPKAAEPH